MKRQYQSIELLGEYIQYYAANNSSWNRFKDILYLDFNPNDIKDKEVSIQKAFDIKRELFNERRNRYNRVAA